MVRNASRKSPYISKSIAKAIQQDFSDMISVGPRYINVSVATFTVCNQHNQIYPSIGSGDEIPRSAEKVSGHDIYFAVGTSYGLDKFMSRISLEDIRDPLEINKSNREPVFNSPYSTGSFFFQVQTQAMRSGCSYHSVMHLNSNSVEKLKLWVNNLKL